MRAQMLPMSDAALSAAADALRAGALVAFPTETVYGLGADATNPDAVARLYAAKGRPSRNPLIAHVPDLDAARRIAELDADARALASLFWPGPLTLIGDRRPGGVCDLAAAGLPTVAVRAPAGPAAALMAAVGRPVAAPSANLSGRLSPTCADAVAEQLGARIDVILDGGPTAIGVESTIVGPGGTVLRDGGTPREQIANALGRPMRTQGQDPAQPSTPGALASHYAPEARLRLDAASPRDGEGWLGFGPIPEGAPDDAATLSESGDLAEAARALFEALRRLDATRAGGVVAVAPIPDHGLGRALNDRLRRAAAPRSDD